MSYIFSNNGTYSGYYNDGDPRVFILSGLNRGITQDEIRLAAAGKTPTYIAGFRVLMYMKEPVLRDIAATVYSESGHKPDESEGIARVIRNRAQHCNVEYSSSNFWRTAEQGGIGGKGIYGRDSNLYRNANGHTIENWGGKMIFDLESTVRALVNPVDITKGAYFWEATDELKRPGNYFGDLMKEKPVYQVTVAKGDTTFIIYNPGHSKYGSNVWP